MIQAYSSALFPPIPVLDVFFAFPAGDDWSGPHQALVDSGADFTIVPMAFVAQLKLPVVRPVYVSSHWHDQRSAYVYEVDIRVGDIILPAVDVVGDRHGNQILLGRNLLNKLDLRLQGPALRTYLLG